MNTYKTKIVHCKKTKSLLSFVIILTMLATLFTSQIVCQAATTTRYEAEDGSYGTKYTKSASTAASGGYVLGSAQQGAYVTISNVNGGNGGTATLDICAAAPTSSYKMHLYVNGAYYTGTASTSQIAFNSGAWGTYKVFSVPITLNPGTSNTIKLNRESGDSSVNLDYFDVTIQVGPSAPVASGISVTGKPVIGDTLTGSYSNYTDSDGDVEDGSVAIWRRADEADFVVNVMELKRESISAGATSTYVPTQDDNGKYIAFFVVPKNAAAENNIGAEINYKITEPVRPPQTKPIVSILQPLSGTRVYTGDSVNLTSKAECDQTTITKVEYYANDMKIGEALADPYEFTWMNLTEGNYNLVARAYNALGESTDSTPVSLIVNTDDPIKISSLFSDNMVLQRNINIKIFGSALNSEGEVTVSFHNQQVAAPVVNGKFQALLAPEAAGGPYVLKLQGKKTGFTKTFNNVMVGEVWVCGGQSNMTFGMNAVTDNVNERNAANYPNIRLFTVGRNPEDSPTEDVNGIWAVCSPSTVTYFSAVGYYFGKKVHLDENVPVGLINAAVGGTAMSWWLSQDEFISDPDLQNYYNGIKTEERCKYYYGMIAPLHQFTIGGVLWYQGESDTYNGRPYEKLLAAMINSWRKAWDQGDFPFLVVQLPNFQYNASSQAASPVREAEMDISKRLPNVGTAVSIDVGENYIIHCPNKKPVGERLALAAEHIWYKDRDMIYSGPKYNSMTVDSNKIRITFDQVGSGLKTTDGAAPANFTICGSDQVFSPATAQIVGTDTIEVSSPDVSNPVAVRYAWSDIPTVNFVNSAGLPASPFRTDLYQLSSNKGPLVNFTSPTQGNKFSKGDSFTLQADAVDYDGDIAKVEFYANEVKVGEATTAPYQYVWQNVPAGQYAVTAIATDNSGASSQVNGSSKATLRPITVQVGRTIGQNTSIINAQFDNYTYDASGTSKPPELSTIDPKTGKIFGVDSPNKINQRSLKMYTEATTEGPLVSAPAFTCNQGSFVVETELLCDSYNAARTIGAFKKNGSSTDTEVLTFDSDGYIKLKYPVTKSIMPYALNTWYKVKVEVNTYTNRINIWINGNQVQNNQLISTVDKITSLTIKQTPVTADPVATYFESINSYSQVAIEDTSEPIVACTLLPFTNASAQQINTLTGQTVVNANVSITNHTDSAKKAVLAVAAYQGNKLLAIQIYNPQKVDGLIDPGEQTNLSGSLNISNYAGADTLKCFVWEDIKDMRPLLATNGILNKQ